MPRPDTVVLLVMSLTVVPSGVPLAGQGIPTVPGDIPLDAQIAAAVLPLPIDLRDGAGVVRWTESGDVEWVRASQNGFSCSMDDLTDGRFDVRCYADAWWPALVRRSQLIRSGLTGSEMYDQIHRDIEEGTLQIPMGPTAGYRMLGPAADFDFETLDAGGEIADWQSIHFPFRTSAALGLTEEEETRQGDRMPFVMASGTWWSHVMITHGPPN